MNVKLTCLIGFDWFDYFFSMRYYLMWISFYCLLSLGILSVWFLYKDVFFFVQEQYRYVHSVLVEAFLLPWKPIHADNIPTVNRQLQEIDQKTGKTNILLEYEVGWKTISIRYIYHIYKFIFFSILLLSKMTRDLDVHILCYFDHCKKNIQHINSTIITHMKFKIPVDINILKNLL